MSDEIQALKTRFVDVHKKVSDRRRQGGYTRIAEILLNEVPARIRMAESDPGPKTRAAVEEIFKRIEDDLKVNYP